ncbi:MAG: LysM peptidoglycan-binding domain-containing protein [Clostridia bacterium]|nr:LysM peptidoglycan-binding domain-containing protein [Clostridia bacterium]
MRNKSSKQSNPKLKKVVLIAILTIIISLFSASYIYAIAIDKEQVTIVEIEVEPGDTLWGLATKYYPDSKDIRKTVYDIKKSNNISGHIYPGQIIKLVIRND